MEEGGARHGGTAQVPDGGGADPTSALPEDLLLEVLRRLGCARAAARTSLISRPWRGLWTRLTNFTFRDVPLRSLLSALHSLARVPEVVLLDIRVSEVTPDRYPWNDKHDRHAARVSSLLLAAADLSPAELRFGVPHEPLFRDSLIVHLPCFLRATSIELHGLNLLLTQLPASRYMFPALETLSVSACHIDVQALLLQCPRLRALRVRATGCLDDDQGITVCSASLQELFVEVEHRDKWTGRIHLEVPALNRLLLSVFLGEEVSVSVSAPVVEKVSWQCSYSRDAAAGIGLWGLFGVKLQTEGNVLSLRMDCIEYYRFPHTELSLAQEIEKHLVVKDFSVLDLLFITTEHAFGAVLFRLLRIDWIRTATKSLKIGLQNSTWKNRCPANCLCDEPENWRSQTISLINLEEVEIKGFKGVDHQFDTLRLIFKCAPMLNRMTVRLSDEATTSNDWCKEIDDIFKAYPSVECSVYPSTVPTINSQTVVATRFSSLHLWIQSARDKIVLSCADKLNHLVSWFAWWLQLMSSCVILLE